jgi:hypothetical protein
LTLSKDQRKENARRELFVHLGDIQDLCESLLAARDPFSAYNEMHRLRSLAGQAEFAAKRYRDIA